MLIFFKKISFLLLFLAFSSQLISQNRPDSLSSDWEGIRQWVLLYHPVVGQAGLLNQTGEAYLLKARGGFDVKTFGDFESKYFKDTEYFRYGELGLKWPTWFGLELKGAFNTAQGKYLNPESSLPTAGQANLGFNWTLGRGLLIDERRADRAQARAIVRQNAAEQRRVVNDLLLDAAKSYWNWVLSGNQLRLYRSVLEQSRVRLEGIRQSYLAGDRPAIDTVEALIQVQTREMDVNFAETDFRNAALDLCNFLWTPERIAFTPDLLPQVPDLEQLLPQARTNVPLLAEWLQRIATHPELEAYRAKLAQLEVERRLKNEYRKPQLDLSYNILGNGWQFFPTNTGRGPEVLVNDVKWGLTYSYPILNRKARADLQITQIKIADTELYLRNKQQMLETKVQQYLNDLDNLNRQINLFGQMTNNYQVMLDGETEKFRAGESSIFLINTREQRWVDARVKYLKLQSEYLKTQAGLRWAAGGQ
jgi:outer membrane protein TolC